MNPDDAGRQAQPGTGLVGRCPPQDQQEQQDEQQEQNEQQEEDEQDEEEDEQEQDEQDVPKRMEQDQPMTEAQASQILESVGEAAQTLQERRGQVLVSTKPPSEFDW